VASKNSKRTRCLAVLGTGSDVGKSIVATALCRILSDRGIPVAPFKAQNLSNNSGVTPEGLEMGRAQIVQAQAARIPPHVDMNPILLKPTSNAGSQLVLLGRAVENPEARQYHSRKAMLFDAATRAFDRLSASYRRIILEGAGSCAEVNLMANDRVNFRMAEYARAPVVLVADIHRGGVFAQIVGTLACLPQAQQDRVAGFVINRFRGDLALFSDGVQWIQARTGKPVFGVLPWFDHIRIEAEDSVAIEAPRPSVPRADQPTVAVVRIPHISNFTDFDPLEAVCGLSVSFVDRPQDLSGFQAVILPGSKSTRSDLDWLEKTGWKPRLAAYAACGGHLLGICGGFQMLGTRVHDPNGLEGVPGTTEALGLLPVETVLAAPKTTTCTRFAWNKQSGSGYEIHMGQTRRHGASPLFSILARNDTRCNEPEGCCSDDGRILGTYIHGLFDTPGITRCWLAGIGLGRLNVTETFGPARRDMHLDRLAAHFCAHVDVQRILGLMNDDFKSLC
jgi:adenosylcobyric acid synthase